MCETSYFIIISSVQNHCRCLNHSCADKSIPAHVILLKLLRNIAGILWMFVFALLQDLDSCCFSFFSHSHQNVQTIQNSRILSGLSSSSQLLTSSLLLYFTQKYRVLRTTYLQYCSPNTHWTSNITRRSATCKRLRTTLL